MIDMHADGQGRIAAHLQEAARRSLNPEPAFEAITGQFCQAEKRLFAGIRKPLKDSTVRRKARSEDAHTRANASTPLVASGKLEKHLTTRSSSAQPVKLTNDELLLGVPGGRSDLHYARYQKTYGRDPLVSAGVVRRFAGRELESFITDAA